MSQPARQLSLPMGYPAPPASRVDTSRAAGETARELAARQRATVYAFIVSRGALGATDEEIQDGTGLRGDSERPRRWELEHAEPEPLIRRSPLTRRTSSGHLAHPYIATVFAA